MIEGIDVSVYQNPTPDLTGLGFLFAKASEGTRPDPLYGMHRDAAAGLVFGAYHYNSNLIGVDAQVAAFLRVAPDADLYALDVEGGASELFTPADAAQFIAGMHAAGKTCGIYHSESGFDAYLGCGQDWNWVANWSKRPSMPFAFWQYRGSPLDLDRFDGTDAELRALAGLTTEVPMPYITNAKPAFGVFTTAPSGATVYWESNGQEGPVGGNEPQQIVLEGDIEGVITDAWIALYQGKLYGYHKSQGTFVPAPTASATAATFDVTSTDGRPFTVTIKGA